MRKNLAMSENPESKPPLVVIGGPEDGDRIGPEGDGTEEFITGDYVEQPAKVMRIGSMIKQLLDEVRQAPLDSASRQRLKEVYEGSVRELASGLSPDLREELDRLVSPFETAEPSDAELRIAHAQLVGWLEGLFHGIQATLFAQQMQARSQLDEMRRRGLPAPQDEPHVPGTYL